MDVGEGSRLSVTIGGILDQKDQSRDVTASLGLRWRLGTKAQPWGVGVLSSLGGGVLAKEEALGAFGASQLSVEAWHHLVHSERLRLISQLSHGSAQGSVIGVGPQGLFDVSRKFPASTFGSFQVRYGRPGGYFGSLGYHAEIGGASPSTTSLALGTAF